MKPTNLNTEILKGICDEARKTNEHVEMTNARLDAISTHVEQMRDELSTRVDQLRGELSHRIVESESRTSTAIADLAGTVRELTSFLKQSNDLRPRVEQCEDDIQSIN